MYLPLKTVLVTLGIMHTRIFDLGLIRLGTKYCFLLFLQKSCPIISGVDKGGSGGRKTPVKESQGILSEKLSKIGICRKI